MSRVLADMEPGVLPGQCAACGAYESAEWTVTVSHDPTARELRPAHWRLCETCYRMVTTLLMNRRPSTQTPSAARSRTR